jgi:hypothetical protein
MSRRRIPEERFNARQWSVTVTDGNGEEWLSCSPDCPVGPVTKWDAEVTQEIGNDIIRALEATIAIWRDRLAKDASRRPAFKPPRGHRAEVKPFPKKKPKD